MLNMLQTSGGGLAFVEPTSSSIGSAVMALSWNVARGATNTVTVGTLPGNARIIAIFVEESVVFNATTTATVSVGLTGGSATQFSAAQDVKTAIGNFSLAATANWAPTAAARSLSCTYTETGTASTTGAATVTVLYCVL